MQSGEQIVAARVGNGLVDQIAVAIQQEHPIADDPRFSLAIIEIVVIRIQEVRARNRANWHDADIDVRLVLADAQAHHPGRDRLEARDRRRRLARIDVGSIRVGALVVAVQRALRHQRLVRIGLERHAIVACRKAGEAVVAVRVRLGLADHVAVAVQQEHLLAGHVDAVVIQVVAVRIAEVRAGD